MAAFRAELNVFIYPVQPVGASDGGTAGVQADVRAFLTRKKEEVKAIIEASHTSVDVKVSVC